MRLHNLSANDCVKGLSKYFGVILDWKYRVLRKTDLKEKQIRGTCVYVVTHLEFSHSPDQSKHAEVNVKQPQLFFPSIQPSSNVGQDEDSDEIISFCLLKRPNKDKELYSSIQLRNKVLYIFHHTRRTSREPDIFYIKCNIYIYKIEILYYKEIGLTADKYTLI